MSRAAGLTFLLAILVATMFMLGACAGGGDEHTENALSEEPVCDVNVTTKACEPFLYAAPTKGE